MSLSSIHYVFNSCHSCHSCFNNGIQFDTSRIILARPDSGMNSAQRRKLGGLDNHYNLSSRLAAVNGFPLAKGPYYILLLLHMLSVKYTVLAPVFKIWTKIRWTVSQTVAEGKQIRQDPDLLSSLHFSFTWQFLLFGKGFPRWFRDGVCPSEKSTNNSIAV